MDSSTTTHTAASATALATKAKTSREARDELIVATVDYLNPAAIRRGGNHSGDMLNEFVLRLDRLIELYDHEKGANWWTFIYQRFDWFAADFFREARNNPACRFTSRSGQTVVQSISADQPAGDEDWNRRDTVGSQLACTHANDVEQRRSFYERLRPLDKQARLIVLLYYEKDLTMKAIGKSLGISESRVSQIHSTTLKSLEQSFA